jgi:hypothetical protein
MLQRRHLTAVLAAVVLLTLGGCSASGLTRAGHEQRFDDLAGALERWNGGDPPEWMPADATQITLRSSNNLRLRVVRFESDSVPAGEGCAAAERTTGPALAADWVPAELPDEVIACGGYEIAEVDGGWLAWESRAPGESIA